APRASRLPPEPAAQPAVEKQSSRETPGSKGDSDVLLHELFQRRRILTGRVDDRVAKRLEPPPVEIGEIEPVARSGHLCQSPHACGHVLPQRAVVDELPRLA